MAKGLADRIRSLAGRNRQLLEQIKARLGLIQDPQAAREIARLCDEAAEVDDEIQGMAGG